MRPAKSRLMENILVRRRPTQRRPESGNKIWIRSAKSRPAPMLATLSRKDYITHHMNELREAQANKGNKIRWTAYKLMALRLREAIEVVRLSPCI